MMRSGSRSVGGGFDQLVYRVRRPGHGTGSPPGLAVGEGADGRPASAGYRVLCRLPPSLAARGRRVTSRFGIPWVSALSHTTHRAPGDTLVRGGGPIREKARSLGPLWREWPRAGPRALAPDLLSGRKAF